MYEKINEIMKKEFIESKSPITLEKYVMSEVLSPAFAIYSNSARTSAFLLKMLMIGNSQRLPTS